MTAHIRENAATGPATGHLRHIVSEQGLTFAAITLVLLVTGSVSGITEVTALAAVTLVLSVVTTIGHTATALAADEPR